MPYFKKLITNSLKPDSSRSSWARTFLFFGTPRSVKAELEESVLSRTRNFWIFSVVIITLFWNLVAFISFRFFHEKLGNLSIINVHILPSHGPAERVRIFRLIHIFISRNCCNHCIYFMGDFNRETSSYDRFNALTQKFCGTVKSFTDTFDELFSDFSEIYQPDFTHKVKYDNENNSHFVFSRLDRVYVRLPPCLLNDYMISSSTTGHIANPTFTLSEHGVLFVNFAPKSSEDNKNLPDT